MKKAIDPKEFQTIVNQKLDDGYSKQQVYDELSDSYFDQNGLRIQLALIPYPVNKNRVKLLNNILLSMLVLTVLYKLLLAIDLIHTTSLSMLPLAMIYPVINIALAYGVYKYSSSAYNYVVMLTLMGALRLVPQGAPLRGTSLLEFLFAISIVVIALIIRFKIYPNFGFMTPEKDENGEIILD